MKIKRKSYFVLLPIIVLLVAATWYGPYDTGDNPRNWKNDEIIAFITSQVGCNVLHLTSLLSPYAASFVFCLSKPRQKQRRQILRSAC